MENAVLDRALLFLGGEISDEGRARLEKLCSMAVSQLENRLKAGESADSLGELFVSAAGILALSMYAALGTEDFSSVKIGSVTLTRNGGSMVPELRKLSEELLSGCLREKGFVFKGVRG